MELTKNKPSLAEDSAHGFSETLRRLQESANSLYGHPPRELVSGTTFFFKYDRLKFFQQITNASAIPLCSA